ncbi:DUF4199 domain-containing protein [uncultured Tenacibaculum sp.]|uniref:DUF4199 domain-containing protein n=1 Tax=uncultured Tenacibaculum sp. TaxID=174713 RepID=UPI002622FE10|nr:DUF4199 domain-containing protein [uncultured Tenacibaculum sp.]
MENQASSKNIILNYGGILGTISVFQGLIMYATGNHLKPHWSLSLIAIVLLIVIIVLGIKKFKVSNNGFLSFGQAVKVGVGIAIFSALISVIYQYIFISFIEPTYMEQMTEIQTQNWIDQGYSEEQIEASQEMAKKFSSPGITAAFSLIGSAIIGFIISAIAGAIMQKREEDTF